MLKKFWGKTEQKIFRAKTIQFFPRTKVTFDSFCFCTKKKIRSCSQKYLRCFSPNNFFSLRSHVCILLYIKSLLFLTPFLLSLFCFGKALYAKKWEKSRSKKNASFWSRGLSFNWKFKAIVYVYIQFWKWNNFLKWILCKNWWTWMLNQNKIDFHFDSWMHLGYKEGEEVSSDDSVLEYNCISESLMINASSMQWER